MLMMPARDLYWPKVVDLPLDNAKTPVQAKQAKKVADDLMHHVELVATLTVLAIHHWIETEKRK